MAEEALMRPETNEKSPSLAMRQNWEIGGHRAVLRLVSATGLLPVILVVAPTK